MWPNPTKPGTSRKTCFWVNSHKRWLAQNNFQIFKFVFSCSLCGKQCILSNAWKNVFKWDFIQTINDGLSLLIPIHSCSKWKTNWPISKKCSETKIQRCHLQNQPYVEKCLCYKHDLVVILMLSLRGYCTSGPYFWRLCAFSDKIKQLWTKFPMDLVRNIPRNSKITVLLQ